MGNTETHLENPDAANPATGLTPKEIYLVQTSFSELRKNMTGTGTKFFMALFNKKPEYQNYFSFRDIPLKELPPAPKFEAHVLTVMHYGASIVDNLDNNEVLFILLRKLGDSHARRGIPGEVFNVAKDVILTLMKQSSTITKEAHDAWDKTLTMAFKVVIDTIKEYKKT